MPLASLFDGHVSDASHPVTNCKGCKDATGSLKLKVSCAVRRPVAMGKGKDMTLGMGVLAVGLGWYRHPPSPSTILHDLPWPSMALHGLPWPSMALHDLPR